MFRKWNRRALSAAAALACVGSLAGVAQAELAFATTQGGFLVSFDTASPGTIISGMPIQGTQNNEQLVGIDFRPATGELFGIGSFSNVYRVNTGTGQVTAAGAAFTPALNGASFGIDFNPTVDRIRQVSDADQNLRLNPSTGQVAATDPGVAYQAGDANFGVNPNLVHAAYTNSRPGAMSTALYSLDAGTDSLVRHVGPAPTFQNLSTIGPMGTDITDIGGFDINGYTGVAYAAIRDVALSRTTFWTVNLNTGAGSAIGEVGGGHILTGLSIVPEPGSLMLIGLASALAALRRR